VNLADDLQQWEGSARLIPRCCERYVRSCRRSRQRSRLEARSLQFRQFHGRRSKGAGVCRGKAVRSGHSTTKTSRSDRNEERADRRWE
jgi:hypothetical protein